jgi:hypothetical protein
MNNSALYIFDLDGTLAGCKHRKHFVSDGKHDWAAFYAACVAGTPNVDVIDTMEYLRLGGADIRVWSGRSEEVRKDTETWLYGNTPLDSIQVHRDLKMRPVGDCTPDEELKKQWLDALDDRDRARLVAVFDDRDKVVAMWRENGVTCFQVAPGNF